MKSNKGYYGWIHSLNQAALVSHKKGRQMLVEQQTRKLAEASIHPDDARDTIARLASEKSSAHSIDLAGGDPIAYRREKNRQRAEEAERLARYDGPIDAKPDGDANEVAYDADDGVMGDPPLSRIPSFNVPNQAPQVTDHPAPWYSTPEAANAAVRELNANKQGYTVNNNNSEYDYSEPDDEENYELPSQNWKTVKESIVSKIAKMMNEGKKPVRGRIVTGGDSEIPARSPNSLDAPRGIFRGTETPREKLGKILKIVSDGPEEHGEEIHSWASNALEVMQKQLRKD